jgi:osmotically-inducible protein OsmY
MNTRFAITCLIIGASFAPVASFSADDADADRSHLDTDENGVVWLSGYARSQDEIDKAVSTAGSTDGVKVVKNDMQVKADD